MFKGQEQVTTFIDKLENFVGAVAANKSSTNVESSIYLNRMREALESFILATSGITTSSDTTDIFICPDCGGNMKLRTNRQNGLRFWGCMKYPNCKGTRDENGLSKEEREEAKYKREEVYQEGGFSFNRDKTRRVTNESGPDDWNPFSKNR